MSGLHGAHVCDRIRYNTILEKSEKTSSSDAMIQPLLVWQLSGSRKRKLLTGCLHVSYVRSMLELRHGVSVDQC